MRIDTKKVEILLAEQGKTKRELAKASGISRQSVSTIIGRGTCEPKNAGRIAAALGVRVAEISVDSQDTPHPAS